MSVDTKQPKKYRKGKITEFRCQFCGQASPVQDWADDTCPKCGLLHVEDDGLGVGWGT